MVRGWALDLNTPAGEGPGMVAVFIVPGPGCEEAPIADTDFNDDRADVAEAFGVDESFATSGFRVAVETEDVPAGPFEFTVCALSAVDGTLKGVTRVVTMMRGLSVTVDTPTDGATVGADFEVVGTALDFDAGVGNGPGVDVVQIFEGETCEGTPIAEGDVDVERPTLRDTIAVDGTYVNAGFAVPVTLPAGEQTIAICAHGIESDELSEPTVLNLTVQ